MSFYVCCEIKTFICPAYDVFSPKWGYLGEIVYPAMTLALPSPHVRENVLVDHNTRLSCRWMWFHWGGRAAANSVHYVRQEGVDELPRG